MNNLNEFRKILNSYAAKPIPEENVKQLIIDIRPNAEVGKMLVTKPQNDDEQEDYVAAMMAGIAELMAPEFGMTVEDLAILIADYMSEVFATLRVAKLMNFEEGLY